MADIRFKKGFAALFTATLFWAGTFIFTKILLAHISTSMLLFVRSLITSAILYTACFHLLNREFAGMLRSRPVWIYGMTGTAALFLQTKGLEYTSATNSAFITAFFIVFIPIIKRVLFKVHIPLRFNAAVMTAVAGLYLISYGFNKPVSINPGDALSLLCALTYAFNIISLEEISVKFHPMALVFFSFAMLTITALFPLLIDTGIAEDISGLFNIIVIANLMALAVLGSIIPYGLMAVGQKTVPAGLASLIYNFEPLFTALLAFMFLNEEITPVRVIGGILIFSSLIIGNKTKI